MTGIRVVQIENDPPHSLNLWQGYEFNDEGYKILAARNKALFGDWKWSQYDNYDGWVSTSPLGVRLYYLVFSQYGFGIAQARFLNVFFGMLTLPFFYGFASRIGDRSTALVATLFLGLNFQFIMYNRLALLETFLTFFIVVTMYFAFVNWKMLWGTPKVLLCTIAFACGYLVKPSILVFGISILPGVAAVYWKTILAARSKMKLVPILMALVGLAVIYWFISPEVNTIVNMVFRIIISRPFSPVYVARNFIVEHLMRQPVLMFCVLVYLYYYLVNYRESVKELPVDLILISWVICGYIFITGLDSNYLRYYLQLLPVESYLAARGIALMSLGRLSIPKVSGQALALAGVLVFFEVSTILAGLIQLFLGNLNFGTDSGLSYTGNVILSSGASLMITSIFLIWLFRRSRKDQSIEFIFPNGRRWASSLIVLVLLVNLTQYLFWYADSKPTIVSYSRELTRITSDAIVGGQDAPMLCVANKLRCINIFFDINDDDEIMKIAPEYLLFRKESAFKRDFERRHPRLMNQAVLVMTYRFGSGLFAADGEVYKIDYGGVAASRI